MMVVAGTFIATFLVVCAIAYLVWSWRKEPPSPHGVKPGEGASKRTFTATVGPVTVPQKVLHTIQWLRRITGAPPINLKEPLHTSPPGLGTRLGLSLVLTAVGVAVLFGVTAVMLQIAKWTLFPLMDAIAPFVWDIFLRPGGAALLALLVIVIGIPLSKRVRRPERFRVGIALISFSLLTFWPMQYFAATRTVPFREYTMILHGIAGFVSLTMFAAGIETLRRSTQTKEDDFQEL